MPDVKVDLPYLTAERLPSGRTRWRVARMIGGERRRTTFYGEPGTPEFHAAYKAAIEYINRPKEDAQREATSYQPQSTGWFVGQFLETMEKRANAGLIAAETLARYKLHLGRLVAHRFTSDKHPAGISVGDLHHELPKRVILQAREPMLDRPGAADNFVKSVSALYTWGTREDVIEEAVRNPALGIERIHGGRGHTPWRIEHIRTWFRAYRPGSLQRLVMVLEVCTAARIGDLVRLGPGNIEEHQGARWLRWTQEKPPQLDVQIPLLDFLAAELEHHDPGKPTWLARQDGRRWVQRSKAGLGNDFRGWRKGIGLPDGLSLHGVRKGIATILPTMGVTGFGIDVVLGHELGSKASDVYTKEANRRAIASSANAEWSGIAWE